MKEIVVDESHGRLFQSYVKDFERILPRMSILW